MKATSTERRRSDLPVARGLAGRQLPSPTNVDIQHILDEDKVAEGLGQDIQHSPKLIKTLEAFAGLADDSLWSLAKVTMSPEASQELEALHFKQRDEGLSPEEDAMRAKLIREYERTMLIRAQAASLLKARGHDVSGLLASR